MSTTRIQTFSRLTVCWLVPLASGCVTTSDAADPAVGAIETARQWQWALAAQDFDAAMDLVADDFSSKDWPARADLAYYFQLASDRDYFTDAVVSDNIPDVMLDGDEAVVYPLELRARLGTAVFMLTLRRTESDWEIVSARLELY